MYATSPDQLVDQGPNASATLKPQRAWPAILTLFVLAPFTAELLSGSTPILVYFTNPLSFVLNPLLYGCGALLVREVARRRGLGWTGVLWLGAAYGIFEEGVTLIPLGAAPPDATLASPPPLPSIS